MASEKIYEYSDYGKPYSDVRIHATIFASNMERAREVAGVTWLPTSVLRVTFALEGISELSQEDKAKLDTIVDIFRPGS